jgi:SulP family sulfate permease
MCNAVNAIDASALESLEAIAHRLHSAGVGFHLSEVKGPVMDALNRSDFMEHFKGRIFLSQFEAVQALSSAKPASRAQSPAGQAGAARPLARPAEDGRSA